MIDVAMHQRNIQMLRDLVEAAGISVFIRTDRLRELAAFAERHSYPTGSHYGRVRDPETGVSVFTEQLPLSAAREMLRRAEEVLARRVAEALS